MSDLILFCSGQFEIAQILIQHGANVNLKDSQGWTPLFVASSSAHGNIVQLLLEHGADYSITNDHGASPLHGCVDFGKFQSNFYLVSLLLIDKMLSLFDSSLLGLEAIMSKLIRLGPNVAVNPFNGRTPLHIAVDATVEKVVKILIENGANVSATDRSGRTPLHGK